jgi:hypothetical protein
MMDFTGSPPFVVDEEIIFASRRGSHKALADSSAKSREAGAIKPGRTLLRARLRADPGSLHLLFN